MAVAAAPETPSAARACMRECRAETIAISAPAKKPLTNRSFVGIEYEGDKAREPEGVRLTKALLEKVRSELA